ncbi:MFS transporter [Pseudonocardia sp. TMWB2A]
MHACVVQTSPIPRRLAALVAGCFVMENLDVTIVTTSAEPLARALGTTPSSVGLVVAAYLVALAVALPPGGWLTGRFGPRWVLTAAIAVFTLASVGCASSGTLAELVGWRVVQGVGAAMMVPVGRLMLLDGVAKRDVPRLMAWIVWPGLAAPVVAPLLGALLTTYASWHWMFLINVPIGVLGLVLALRWVPDTPGRGAGPLDVPGLVLCAAGLGGLVSSSALVDHGLPVAAGVAVAAGAVVLAVAGRHLLRTAHPLVDVRVLRVRTFRASSVGGALFWAVVTAVPFLLPLLFQQVFGWSATTAGAVVVAVFAGNIAAKPATTALIRRFGLRTMAATAAVAVAATLAVAATWSPDAGIVAVVVVCALSGAARSVGLTMYSILPFTDVTGPELRHANTLAAVVQQTSMGLGVALASAVLAGAAALTSDAPAAFRVTFAVFAVLALVVALDVLRLPRGAGDAVRS